MNLNQVNVIGRITKKPELKALPNGTKVVKLGIATNRTWKQDGVKKEETEFHSAVAFGQLAEIIEKYIEKGQLIFIQGRLHTSSWEADGQKKYKTEIIVEQMQMGPRANGEHKAETEGKEEPKVEEEVNVNDIPF